MDILTNFRAQYSIIAFELSSNLGDERGQAAAV